MCRRFAILSKIDQLGSKDVLTYLSRVIKLYVIFACLAIYNASTAVTNSGQLLVGIKVADAVIYCIYVCSLIFFTQSPSVSNIFFPLVSSMVLDFFYVISLILQIFFSIHKGSSSSANIAVSALTALISIFLLSTMVYLLVKLRTKMILEQSEMTQQLYEQGPVNTVASPISIPTAVVVVSYPTAASAPMKPDFNV